MAGNNTILASIDFGALRSYVGVWNEEEMKVEILKCEAGADHNYLPTYVYYSPTGTVEVGSAAHRGHGSSDTIYFVKQLLGRKYDHESDVAGLPSGHCRPYISNREPYFKLSSGKTVTPEQIYVTILTELKRIIQDRFPLKKVIKAVFTVPATATDEYRRIVKQSAGKNGAGFDEVYLLSEPSAAVVAFHVEVGSGDGQNVTIIDIRGDTTEVSISAFRNSELEVLAKTSKDVGGINIEHAIVDYVLQQLDQLNADDALRNRIRIAWLKVKNELVKKGNTRIAVEGFNAIPLTIDKFNALNADNFDKIVATVQYAMDSISMDVGQVNEVTLIGSLSRVPRIVELVEQYFKKKIIDNSTISFDDPDEVVIYGATCEAGRVFDEGDNVIILD